jgi:hypothetical protein
MSHLLVKSHKQHIRLWFEFYKLILDDNLYSENLLSLNGFYSLWGDVTRVKFDDWWVIHSDLFGSLYVQEIDRVDSHPNTLNISIPLNLSSTTSLDQIKQIIENKQKERLDEIGIDPRRLKSSRVGFGDYELTSGVEIRGSVVHETLTLYRYWLEMGRPPINITLVNNIRELLNNRPRSKWIPFFMIDDNPDDPSNVIRQLRRRINRGKKICESVSLGEFPGGATLN